MKNRMILTTVALAVMTAVVTAAETSYVVGPEAWLNFMGGNVRKDGLRLDLEAIRAAGISGIHFFHVDRPGVGVWPDCEEQIPCMSEKWFDIIRFLGEECERLGLALTVQNCPGWSQSGGPWVSLDHCQRDIEMSRSDFAAGDAFSLPEIPAKFRDADSDWRDVAVLAFPTPEGDAVDDTLKPVKVEKDGNTRVYRFAKPVTVRTLDLQPVKMWNRAYTYHMPWIRVKLDVETPEGWKTVISSPLPTSNWRDYVLPFSLACGETMGDAWRLTVEHDYPISPFRDPVFRAAARHTDWQGKSARTLRSLLREDPPPQKKSAWVDSARIIDLTGKSEWTVPAGKWTVIRLGHVNAKRVNAPAPKEATGWECDKLDPAGIEASFKGYIGRLNEGILKGKMRGMLVDSWECFGQTWTPKMEKYFAEANSYALRTWLPALFGWIVDSPQATERFLTDWRRTNGDLITKNYYGHMARLAHDAGLEVYYETAFGDIVYGDLLEYWKYSDAPMCEYWLPHLPMSEGFTGCYAYKPVRPCASAAHIYGKRRVVAEAFTGEGISWQEDFRELQDIANRHFARGVTHLAFQSYTHAPQPDATPPGGCMGGFNGTPFTRLQTWWKHMPEFTRWLTRCEAFLEAGQPAQDVLWYLGDAVDHKPDEEYDFPEGFRADYLNHDVLTNRLAVKEGFFTIPEGARWRVLWVPDERFMLLATKSALGRLAAAGGKVVYGGKDALVRALAGTQQDVATDPALGDGPSEDFMWIHRHVDGSERYFVAAGTNGYRGKVTFRAGGVVSVFDPVSLERRAWTNGGILEIPPSRSVFVEFGVAGSAAARPRAAKKTELTGWTLSFPSGWGAPATVKLERPVSWTQIPGFSREAQAFAGTVVYETAFDCEAEGERLELDLGRVESIAEVFVNGKPVRTLWCEPYRCCLDGFVRKGRNELRIEVTNTWRNRVIYDLGLPEAERKTWIIYQKNYNPGPGDPFVESGLVAPVWLTHRAGFF